MESVKISLFLFCSPPVIVERFRGNMFRKVGARFPMAEWMDQIEPGGEGKEDEENEGEIEATKSAEIDQQRRVAVDDEAYSRNQRPCAEASISGKKRKQQSMREAREEHEIPQKHRRDQGKYSRVDNSIKQEACEIARQNECSAAQVLVCSWPPTACGLLSDFSHQGLREAQDSLKSRYPWKKLPSERTVREWLKNKDYFLQLSGNELCKKSDRKSPLEDVEWRVHRALLDYVARGGRVTGNFITAQAKQAAAELRYSGYQGLFGDGEEQRSVKFSEKWLRRFKERFGWEKKKL